jgi:hypothetical protein
LNLALYAAYAGDFKTAEQEARETEKLGGALAMLPMAFAQLGQGQLAPAANFYQQLAKVNPQALSTPRPAYLAVYEGRFSDAVRILEESAAGNVKSKNPIERPPTLRRSPKRRSCDGRTARLSPPSRAPSRTVTPSRFDFSRHAPSLRWATSREPEHWRPASRPSFKTSLRPTAGFLKVRWH